ncbi:MAG: hypothetical protein KatS3mg044_0575 [Rhodothermaceae bacterium]|nr:MAG: hypothetical protein D6746_01925 [Bacteroidota bacterium]GIV61709.1 MAG: hypothetical protein KatS3mg044_0575 [Rhodothermaceae bacterium]
MFWVVIVLAATALLAWLLVALRRFEHESATAALDEVRALRAEMEHLEHRVRVLEALAASGDDPDDVPFGQVPNAPESVSSPKRSSLRT